MNRRTLLVVLMMVAAVLVPATVVGAVELASDESPSTEYDLSSTQMWKAEMIAGYLAEEGSEEDEEVALALVVGLRTEEPAMGWGVLSKLVAYAVASDMSLEEYLESARNEDGGYSMGHLRKEYLADPENGELPYKNFGQMQKAEKPPKPPKADKKTPPGQAKKSQG
jgi:hypothetical protein